MINCITDGAVQTLIWRKKMNQVLYAGIDVSKDKVDVAISAEKGKIIANSTFENSLSSTGGFNKLKNWLKVYASGFNNIHFCIEATSFYHEQIAEFLQDEGFIVSVINPFQSKSFARSKLYRTKNDKVDAAILANYSLVHQPAPIISIPEEIRKLRSYTRNMDKLVSTRAEYRTKLQNCKNSDVAHVLKGTILSLTESISQFEDLIERHIQNFPQLRKKIDLLKSIPGIGNKTALTILSELHIEDGKNLNVKAQVAHAGLAPREFQSGKSIRGKTKICKTGNAALRKALFMPSMCAIQKNPVLKAFYQKLLDRGKLKMVALVAAMRKLLAICIGVLRSNQPFQVDWVAKQEEKFALST